MIIVAGNRADWIDRGRGANLVVVDMADKVLGGERLTVEYRIKRTNTCVCFSGQFQVLITVDIPAVGLEYLIGYGHFPI